MGDFSSQVYALLKKDLLLKKRRRSLLLCECFCPLIFIALTIAQPSLSKNSDTTLFAVHTKFEEVSNHEQDDAEGKPLPSECLGGSSAKLQELRRPPKFSRPSDVFYIGKLDPTLHFAWSTVRENPLANMTKMARKFAVGPAGEVGDRLKKYFDARIDRASKTFGSSRALYDEIEYCFQNQTQHNLLYENCFLRQEFCLRACAKDTNTFPVLAKRTAWVDVKEKKDSCFNANSKGVNLTVAKIEDNVNYRKFSGRIQQEVAECESLKACACADATNCGWSKNERRCGERTRRGFDGEVDCSSCPQREECSAQALWKKMGNGLDHQQTTVVVVSGNGDLDTKVAADATYCGGVVFEKSRVAEISSSKSAEYTLRFVPHTETFQPLFNLVPSISHFSKVTGPQLHLQYAVDHFITCRDETNTQACLGAQNFNDVSKLNLDDVSVTVTAFPFLPRKENLTLNEFLRPIMTVVLCISGVAWSTHLLKEKDYKVREAMRAHGVRHDAYYTSMVLFISLWTFVTSLIPSLGLASALHGMGYATNFVVVLLMWLAFWNIYALTSFLTTFFKKTFPDIFLILTLIQIVDTILVLFTMENPSRGLLLCAALFPARNWNLAMDTVNKLEEALRANEFSIEVEFFSLGDSVMMSIIGIIVWQVLFVYCDLVFGDASAQYPWYFPVSPAFWRSLCNKPRVGLTDNEELGDGDKLRAKNDYVQPATQAEKDQAENNCMINISNLTKRYGNFTAVNGINAQMYAGEIFALLGHNGAGKTTTFSMLTGMSQPTSGQVQLFGIDLRDYLANHRSKVGFCPQQNMVWPILSVDEHLSLFRSFKGLTQGDESAEEKELDALLGMLGLANKKTSLVSQLSGGMVRKLCLAASLLGNPNVVFLDEPTSGLDTATRREVWDVLRTRKKDRVVILSTHYMDEADALADRIGIMSHGVIQCNGSPSFLKEKYGCGYNLTCLMSTEDPTHKEDVHKMIADKLNSDCVDNGDQRSPVEILTNVGREVTFLLSFNAAKKFQDIFGALDEKDVFHVENYTIGVSNLEEVFLKVTSGIDTSDDASQPVTKEVGNISGIGGVAPASGASTTQQMRALLTKRYYYAKRNILIKILCGKGVFFCSFYKYNFEYKILFSQTQVFRAKY